MHDIAFNAGSTLEVKVSVSSSSSCVSILNAHVLMIDEAFIKAPSYDWMFHSVKIMMHFLDDGAIIL